MMDDGEIDSPDSGVMPRLPSSDYSHFLEDSSIIQSGWDNLLMTTKVCSHKHICNPTSGPDNTHTHTCEHTHTHTISSGEEEKNAKKKRPSGNKEAVRKYREKQKAVKVNLEVRNADLEKENRRIPELLKENHRLRRKLQEHAPTQEALEQAQVENKRLKGLLLQLRRLVASEVDSVNYERRPSTVSRGDAGDHAFLTSGSFYSSEVPCVAPQPCYPSRLLPLAGLSELDSIENAGWESGCDQINAVCHEVESDANASYQCSTGRAEASTEDPCSVLPSGFNHKQLPSTLRVSRRRNKFSQSIPIGYQSTGVSCAAPVPCFSGGQSPLPGLHRQQERVDSLSWRVSRELLNDICQDTEMTVDSRPNCTSLSPEEVSQSVSAASMKDAVLTSSKPLIRWSISEDRFPSESYYADGPQCASVPPCYA